MRNDDGGFNGGCLVILVLIAALIAALTDSAAEAPDIKEYTSAIVTEVGGCTRNGCAIRIDDTYGTSSGPAMVGQMLTSIVDIIVENQFAMTGVQ